MKPDLLAARLRACAIAAYAGTAFGIFLQRPLVFMAALLIEGGLHSFFGTRHEKRP